MWKVLKEMNVYQKPPIQLPPGLSNVNVINNHFVQSIPKGNNSMINILQNYSNSRCNSVFKFTNVDEAMIQRFINSISTQASGHDGINIAMIKYCCPCIVPYVVHIINNCFEQGVFPSTLKEAIIKPRPLII